MDFMATMQAAANAYVGAQPDDWRKQIPSIRKFTMLQEISDWAKQHCGKLKLTDDRVLHLEKGPNSPIAYMLKSGSWMYQSCTRVTVMPSHDRDGFYVPSETRIIPSTAEALVRYQLAHEQFIMGYPARDIATQLGSFCAAHELEFPTINYQESD